MPSRCAIARHAVLLALIGSLGTGLLLAASPPAPSADIKVTVRTDKPVYASTDPIVMSLTVTNTSADSVELSFRSSQRYDFEILDEQGHTVWSWSKGRVFTLALGRMVLPGGASHTYTQRVNHPLSTGRYKLVGSLVLPDHPLRATGRFTVQ